MCMNCGSKAAKSNSYTPKKATASKPSASKSMPKGWAGTSGAYGSPKVRMSFGKR